MLFLHHDNTISRPGQIQGGRQSGRPAANHYNIVKFFDILHTLQLPHKVKARLQGLGPGLPFGRAHLIPVFMHELAGLQLA